ncbi:MAG: hypothetical protein OEV06_12760, partial [Anaerolineae bacterium]|nr:hypothetical protein [Anaerolineae bacterium]
MFDGKALARPGVEDTRLWQPVFGQLGAALPGHGVLLAAPPERAPPEVGDVVAKRLEGVVVARHGVIGEVAAHDLPEPLSLLADRLVHLPPQVLLDGPQLGPLALAAGPPFELEPAPAAAAADVG